MAARWVRHQDHCVFCGVGLGGRTPLIRCLRSVLAKTTRGEPDLPRAQEDMERVGNSLGMMITYTMLAKS